MFPSLFLLPLSSCGVYSNFTEGDLYEDGLALRNGFFRSRRFNAQSEGSLDLFSDERREESGGEEGEGEGEGEVEVEVEDTQMEALRRKDRLEREEFMRKCRVGA